MRTQSIPTSGIDRTSVAFFPRTTPTASRQVDRENGGMDTKSTLTHRDERLLTDPEACDYLRIGSRQLLSWRRRGWIPFIHIGYAVRYRKRDLDVALDAMTVVCPPASGCADDGATLAGNSNREGSHAKR